MPLLEEVETVVRDLEQERQVRAYIDELKALYHDVFVVQVYDNEFIYRLPSLLEVQDLEQRFPDTLIFQEELCRLCVLDPVIEDWTDDIPAGYVDSLATHIMEASGAWWDKSRIIKEMEEASNRLASLNELIPLTIKKAFPEYPLIDIRQWSFPRQLEYFGYAKWLINIDQPEFSLEIKD